VARECLASLKHRDVAESLGIAAIAAAREQLEPAELTAIMYERGKLDLAAGDRAPPKSAGTSYRPGPRGAAKAQDFCGGCAKRSAAIGEFRRPCRQFQAGASIAEAAAEND